MSCWYTCLVVTSGRITLTCKYFIVSCCFRLPCHNLCHVVQCNHFHLKSDQAAELIRSLKNENQKSFYVDTRRFYLTFLCTNIGSKCLPNMFALRIQYSFLQFYKQNTEYWTRGTRVQRSQKVKRKCLWLVSKFHSQLNIVCQIKSKLVYFQRVRESNLM